MSSCQNPQGPCGSGDKGARPIYTETISRGGRFAAYEDNSLWVWGLLRFRWPHKERLYRQIGKHKAGLWCLDRCRSGGEDLRAVLGESGPGWEVPYKQGEEVSR